MPDYTNNVPQATQTIAFTQPLIQDNFAYLEDVIDKDHNFSGTSPGATDGYHKVSHHITQGADPAPIAGVLQTYSLLDGETQLRSMDGSGNISRLTGSLTSTNGYQWIGGCLMQWGFIPLASSGSAIVNFPIAFPNGCLNITGSGVFGPSVPSQQATVSFRITNNPTPPPPLNVPSTTQFIYYYDRGSSTSYRGFTWIAIGY